LNPFDHYEHLWVAHEEPFLSAEQPASRMETPTSSDRCWV